MDPRQRLMMQLQHADEINWGSGKQTIPIKPTDFSNNRSESMPWGVDIPRPVNDKPLEPEDPIGTALMMGQPISQGFKAAMSMAGRQGSRAGLGMQRAMSGLAEGMENSELQGLHSAGMRPDPFRPGVGDVLREHVTPSLAAAQGEVKLSNDVLANMPQPEWQAFHQRAADAVSHAPVPSSPTDFSIPFPNNMGNDTLNRIIRGGDAAAAGPLTNNVRVGALGKAPPPPAGLGPSTGSKWDALEQHLNAGIKDSSLTPSPVEMKYGNPTAREIMASTDDGGSVFTGNVYNSPMSGGRPAGSYKTIPGVEMDQTDPISKAFGSRVKTLVSPGVPTTTHYR